MRKGIETKYLILHGWKRREQELRVIWKWELLLALVIGQAPLSLWLPRSRTKITRSHGPITLWMWMFSTVLHFLVLPEIETLQEKKNWYMKLSQPLPPMPAILGDFTCAVYQVTFMAPKYHFLDARWSLGSKLVFWTFFGVLYRVRNARSAFYAWVRIFTQSVMRSPRFIPSPCFTPSP